MDSASGESESDDADLVVAAAMVAFAGPVAAQQAGDGYRCPGPDGFVLATVGRVDLLSEIAGEARAPDPTIAHVYLETAEDFVGHAAFEAAALLGCQSEDNTPFDDVAFAEGLDAYMAAARAGEATYFTETPGEAFDAALARED